MYYLIFDIGGSSIKYAVGDADGNLLEKGKTESSGENLDEFLNHLKEIYEQYQRTYHFTAVAVSSPGFVDTEHGIVYGLSSLPYLHNFPLAPMISEHLCNLPVCIENDGNCGALGEYWKGGWGNVRRLVMLVCGSGIGGGCAYDGRIWHTSHFCASEFGFMPIVREAERTLPWSQYSVVNVAGKYNECTHSSISPKELFDRPKEDSVAYYYTEQFFHYLAVGSFCVGFALDPDLVVISGAISTRPDFGKRLHKKTESLKAKCREYAEMRSDIVVSKIGNDANLYGALYHAVLGEICKGNSSVSP